MKYVDFASLVRLKTKTDSTTLPDADLVLLMNEAKDSLSNEIISANENIFGLRMTRNLIADQREYSLPDELLQIKRLEAMIDGTNLKIIDEEEFNLIETPTSEAEIRNSFSEPRFHIFGQQLFIYSADPIINVTGGMKLWAIVFPSDFITSDLSSSTDMAVSPSDTQTGFPRQFHELLARRVVIDWKSSQEKPIPLTEREQRFDIDFEKALNALRGMNLDRSTVASVPCDTGENY